MNESPLTTSRGDERRDEEREGDRVDMSQEEVRIEVFDGCDARFRFRFFDNLR